MSRIIVFLIVMSVASAKRRHHDNDNDNDDEGNWMDGFATYYWASEADVGYGSGDRGSNGAKLVPHFSVAVKGSDKFEKHEGHFLEIKGKGIRRVDDYCAGQGCKTLDLYVGRDQDGWDGVDKIEYRYLSGEEADEFRESDEFEKFAD